MNAGLDGNFPRLFTNYPHGPYPSDDIYNAWKEMHFQLMSEHIGQSNLQEKSQQC